LAGKTGGGWEPLLAALTAAAAGGPLGGQAIFLSLGAEEPAVLQFAEDSGVLD